MHLHSIAISGISLSSCLFIFLYRPGHLWKIMGWMRGLDWALSHYKGLQFKSFTQLKNSRRGLVQSKWSCQHWHIWEKQSERICMGAPSPLVCLLQCCPLKWLGLKKSIWRSRVLFEQMSYRHQHGFSETVSKILNKFLNKFLKKFLNKQVYSHVMNAVLGLTQLLSYHSNHRLHS